MIGHFETDRYGMPVFHYADNLPYKRSLSNGDAVRLPEDPWFLLGNYQLTLFAHVSGEYELICGQRSWGRLNQTVGRINSEKEEHRNMPSPVLILSRRTTPLRRDFSAVGTLFIATYYPKACSLSALWRFGHRSTSAMVALRLC